MLQQYFKEFFLQDQIQELYRNEELLHQVTLRFLSQELELEYQNRQMAKVVVQFRVSTILQILINIGFIINAGVVYDSDKIVIFRSVFVCWMLICLLVQKIFTKQWSIVINVLVSINGVFSVLIYSYFAYNIIPTLHDDMRNVALISGLQQGLFAMSYFLIQPCYLMQSFTMLGFFMILMGIFTQFGEYRLWTQYVLLVFTIYLLRQNEKTNRMNFLQLFKSHQNLESCKKIYDEIVPTSIILLEENQILETHACDLLNSAQTIKDQIYTQENKQVNILYFNKHAQIHFQTFNQECLLQQLQTIEIINNDDNKQQNLFIGKLIDKISIIQTSLQTKQITKYNQLDYQILSSKILLQCQRPLQENQYQYYDVQAQGCIWEGKQIVMLILTETTDRILRIKHLQELDAYKDSLLATVSHDLKTPIHSSEITIELLKDKLSLKDHLKKDEIQEIQHNLDHMQSNQKILITMINDLLDYSQLKTQSLRLNIHQFQLKNCIYQIKQMFQEQIDLKKLKFIIEGLNEEILMVSDSIRLQQILFNLIANAIKFTSSGSIKLLITQQQKHNKNFINFVVTDTGLGIPKNIQNTLFQAYKTYNIGNCNARGVGLGLAISKHLVGLLGPEEKIDIISNEGEGSTFSFLIYKTVNYKDGPRASLLNDILVPQNEYSNFIIPTFQIAPPQRLHKKYRTMIDAGLKNKKIQVLIVDDTVFNIYALKSILDKLIFKKDIEEAHNGVEAIKNVKQKYYDLIFMDVSMPLMDGLEATIEIRKYQEKEKTKKSIIIMLTGFSSEGDAEKSISAGADLHLEKPLKIPILKSLLEQFKVI